MTKTNSLCYAAATVAGLAFTVACSDAATTTPDGGTGGDATGVVGTGGDMGAGATTATGGDTAGTGGEGLFGPGNCPLANCSGGADAGTGGGTSTGGGFTGGPDPVEGEACGIPGDLIDSFIPSGYANDYTMLVAGDCEEAAETCMSVTIDPSLASTGEGYAGLFWLHGGNWGPDEGESGCVVPEGMQVTFMARGVEGGEVVAFNAEGLAMGDEVKPTLTTEFVEYTVDLSNSTALANMYFALLAYPAVPAEGMTSTFEIKDIKIEAVAD